MIHVPDVNFDEKKKKKTLNIRWEIIIVLTIEPKDRPKYEKLFQRQEHEKKLKNKTVQ